mmetsp:Transcript_11880/g.32567  ORF Transcript_11880/g.32567 Transcript_11880/m.32567 type:complete len:250 (-) Transcript_11880:93-842(-)
MEASSARSLSSQADECPPTTTSPCLDSIYTGFEKPTPTISASHRHQALCGRCGVSRQTSAWHIWRYNGQAQEAELRRMGSGLTQVCGSRKNVGNDGSCLCNALAASTIRRNSEAPSGSPGTQVSRSTDTASTRATALPSSSVGTLSAEICTPGYPAPSCPTPSGRIAKAEAASNRGAGRPMSNKRRSCSAQGRCCTVSPAPARRSSSDQAKGGRCTESICRGTTKRRTSSRFVSLIFFVVPAASASRTE